LGGKLGKPKPRERNNLGDHTKFKKQQVKKELVQQTQGEKSEKVGLKKRQREKKGDTLSYVELGEHLQGT